MSEEKSGQRILVVDDEASISDLIATSLKFVGFDVRTAATGSQALTIAEEFKPHAMILDVMLPDLDGFEVCRQIRNEGIEVGVLFLSAKDEMKDKVQGLTIGGDDYMTKPFSPKELMLRVKNLLKRSQKQTSGSVLECGPFRFVKGSLLFYIDGEQVDLTATEFKLMLYLCERANVVQNRADLLVEVMGYSDDVHSRTLDTHMKRLRRKLGGYIDLLETVRGIGYQVTIVSK